ncbi:flavin reductase family protein [Lentiprolixibacter aurantiacus]|uniref:Flavin reductase n=1 Tax=Lentiprolixibacter aurantiacus TaxID=2993939 RepID=A0AAE3MKE8_9FLAO|nr:flavin reductase [Lentiprolixibacter aurantiacus]MCX2719261.1 flavin reductase [Lentiprolixibacter aurantiacus]
MLITRTDLDKMPSRQRARLMNTLSGYKPANLIGSISDEGVSNLAIFNSVIHMGSSPPLLGLLFRPLTVRRDTYTNIKTNGCFTINAVNLPIYRQAHQTAAKYEEEESEFDKTGLKERFITGFPAPFVEESPILIGCRYASEYPIKENGTILLLGAIEIIQVKDSLLQADGTLALDKEEVMATSGLDGYALPKIVDRLNYAQPGQEPGSLSHGTQKN